MFSCNIKCETWWRLKSLLYFLHCFAINVDLAWCTGLEKFSVKSLCWILGICRVVHKWRPLDDDKVLNVTYEIFLQKVIFASHFERITNLTSKFTILTLKSFYPNLKMVKPNLKMFKPNLKMVSNLLSFLNPNITSKSLKRC
jgi:hypothetical protein